MRCQSIAQVFLALHAALAIEDQKLLVSPAAAATSSLLSLHQSLVERASVTGSERNVSDFLESYLEAAGWTVELQPVERNRDNVLAYQGSRRANRVLVTSHIDTVPPFFPYERRGDEIWGRGTSDAKGSVATQIHAVELLRKDGTIGEGDVAMLYVVGEEKGGLGMQAANSLGLSWEAVIFGEPTELKLARGHKGGLAFNVTAKGMAGHSGYPEQGRNAIDILVDGLSALKAVALPSSEEFGNTTLNIGQIQGGVAANVIPGEASATVLVRVAVEDTDGIKSLVDKTIRDASPWLDVSFSPYAIAPVPIDYDVAGTCYGDSRTVLKC